jgi:hypothetical protein
MTALKVTLDQQARQVTIDNVQIKNEVVFSYFDKLPSSDRADLLVRAIYIGVLALMENRISTFLAKTSNDLGTELESLKLLFDLKNELFFKSTASGLAAESDIRDFLEEYFKKSNLKDTAELTGDTKGLIVRNKTGDILCRVDGRDDVRIAVESKLDKSIKLGEVAEKDIFSRGSDTAIGQLIEAAANRNARVAIIVFDKNKIDQKILNIVKEIKYLPEIGFISIVDVQAGDYRNLTIAYLLARDIAINTKSLDLDKDLLSILIERIVRDLQGILDIKYMVEQNIEQNKKILKKLEQSVLSMEFNRDYLRNFLKEGTLTKLDLLEFYRGGDLRDKFKPIEKEIEELGKP